MVFGWSPFRIVSDNPPAIQDGCCENSAKNHLKIIFSEIAGPIGSKLWWNGLQVVLFENCVRRPSPPTKIAAVTKNRKFCKKSLKNYLLWNYWANWAQTMVEWSLGVVIFQNCVRRPRPPTKMATITKNRKFSKKSLKNYLFWNCWVKWAQNMVKWSLDGPFSELYPTTPPAKEDGGHC